MQAQQMNNYNLMYFDVSSLQKTNNSHSIFMIIRRGKAVKVYCADIAEDRFSGCLSVWAEGGIVWPLDASEEDLIALTASKLGKMDAAVDIVGSPKTFRSSFYR